MQSIVKMNEELKIRLFYVLSITAIVANTIGFISNAIIYGFTSITIFTLVCAIIMYIAGIMGMYTKNSKLPSVIILVLGNIIEFPVLYLVYGAYYILYMILGIVSTVLFLEEKWQIIGSLFIFFISKEQISKNSTLFTSSTFILNPLFLKFCPLAFIFIGIISLITHKISFSHTPLLFTAYLSFNKLRLLNSILYSFSIVSKIALYNATEIPLFNLIFKKSL